MAMVMVLEGCYVYAPVRPADAVLETRVRATVSPEVAAELAPALRNVSTQLVGELTERSADAILVDVPLFGAAQGASRVPVHNRVRIPMDGLVSLESRRLSRWRTGVVLGSLVAAVTTGFVVISGDDVTNDKPKTGTDNAIRVRIPIGFGFR